MAASLTLSAYFESDCPPEVPAREIRLHTGAFVDNAGKRQSSSAGRFMEILSNSVANMDDDETLLAGKDRINIFAVNIF